MEQEFALREKGHEEIHCGVMSMEQGRGHGQHAGVQGMLGHCLQT